MVLQDGGISEGKRIMNAYAEDFTPLHKHITGTHAATSTQRRYPTTDEMRAFLAHVNSPVYRASKEGTRIAHEYYAAINNGLIEAADRVWTSGAPNARHTLTGKGLKYLRWLDRVSGADRDDLRQYERRYSTWARWCAALCAPCEIDDHAAEDALHAARCEYRNLQPAGMAI